MRYFLILLMLLLAGCSFLGGTPDPNIAIRQSVAQTVAAFPPTSTSAPLPTPYPSPTPMTLAGLFCEYQFCIGHPSSMAFYDHLAAQSPLTPSTYANGFLAAYQVPGMLINLLWLQAPG